MPENKPTIVDVPKMNYIAVRGKGDPNAEDGEYKQAVGLMNNTIAGDKNVLTQSDVRRGVGATGTPPPSAYDLSKYKK